MLYKITIENPTGVKRIYSVPDYAMRSITSKLAGCEIIYPDGKVYGSSPGTDALAPADADTLTMDKLRECYKLLDVLGGYKREVLHYGLGSGVHTFRGLDLAEDEAPKIEEKPRDKYRDATLIACGRRW